MRLAAILLCAVISLVSQRGYAQVADAQQTQLATPGTLAPIAARARRRRVLGWTLITGGLVIGVAGVLGGRIAKSHWVDQRNRYNEARILSSGATGEPCVDAFPAVDASTCREQLNKLKDGQQKYTVRSAVGFAIAGLGAAVVLTGLIFLLKTPKPARDGAKTVSSWQLQPTVSAGVYGLQAAALF